MEAFLEIKLTRFKNTYDRTTEKTVSFSSFHGVEEYLCGAFNLPARKPKKNQPVSPIDAELLSPAIYGDGASRSNAGVTGWHGVCFLDVDNYEGAPEKALEIIEDYHYICYSTASSTKEHPKFRLVFPLTDVVSASEIRAFWYAISQETNGMADQQTCDPARMYFRPGQYEGAYNFFFINEGQPINPKQLMAKHPYVPANDGKSFFDKLPSDLQEMIISQKKASASNTSGIKWRSFKDCPFINKKLLATYQAATSGDQWYHTLYSIMTSISSNAIKAGYPITAHEVAELAGEIHADTRGFPSTRKLVNEATRAVAWAYNNAAR